MASDRVASLAERRQARFATACREGRFANGATVALFPLRVRRRWAEFDVTRRDTGSTIRTSEEGMRAIRLLQAGGTLGSVKHELARHHKCDPSDIDLADLLDSLVEADIVSDVDGYPISANAPLANGPLEAFIAHYVRLPLTMLLVHRMPLRIATLLLHPRLAPRRNAYLLRRIRGNMRSAPAMRDRGNDLTQLARDNYDAIGRMYLERLMLLELPPTRMTQWLRDRCRISGLEHLVRAHASGRGVVLVGSHVGSFSLMPYLIATQGFRVTYLDGVATTRDETIERRRAELRAAGIDRPLTYVGGPLGVRTLARCVQRGETAMLLCDTGVASADDGVELPFLGRQLRATTGAAWLGRRTGAPILPVIITWQADGSHLLRIEPEVQVSSPPSDACYDADVMSAIHTILEGHILEAPAQWHKWKDFHDMSAPLSELSAATGVSVTSA